MTQAVILAGGRGTRLSAVSGGLPKVLIEAAGVPIIERQIRLLARYDAREIFLTTGYGAEIVAEQLGDGSRFGVQLHYEQEDDPLGTAGGVGALRDRLRDAFYVFYGDVLVYMDLGRLMAFHRRVGAVATLVVHPNDHPFDSDLVALERDGRVSGFHPKPRPDDGPDLSNMVSAAVYVLDVEALSYIETGVDQDFVRDVFPRMLASGAPLYGYRTTEYLKDMGTPERLARVERDLEAGLVESVHRDHPRPTAFLDRDGVINREVGGVHDPDRLELLPGAAEAIGRLNRAGWLVGVITNQPDVAKGFMREDDVAAVHRRLERLLGDEGAWLDDLAFCPHHPERGFAGERIELKIACSCRKPAPGMLEALADRLPIDAASSVVIGDTWRDMAAAAAFGVSGIGVDTGHGQRTVPPETHRAAGRPSVQVADLAAATSLLLDVGPQIEDVADRVEESCRKRAAPPTLIFVGGAGASRSGAVFQLCRRLRARSLRCLWIPLEDLLGSDGIPPAVDSLARGGRVEAPGLDPWSGGRLPTPVVYDARDADVVVIEGPGALQLARPIPEHIRVSLLEPGSVPPAGETLDFCIEGPLASAPNRKPGVER